MMMVPLPRNINTRRTSGCNDPTTLAHVTCYFDNSSSSITSSSTDGKQYPAICIIKHNRFGSRYVVYRITKRGKNKSKPKSKRISDTDRGSNPMGTKPFTYSYY